MKILDKIRESNLIEGITREPTGAEMAAHIDFLQLDKIRISDIEKFVARTTGVSMIGTIIYVSPYYISNCLDSAEKYLLVALDD